MSDWTRNTLEQAAIHQRLITAGVQIVLNRGLAEIHDSHVMSCCMYTGEQTSLPCEALVMVTSRIGNDSLWQELNAREAEWADFGIRSVKVFGDAEAPGPIAWATYAGHRYARELDGKDIGDAVPFRREVIMPE